MRDNQKRSAVRKLLRAKRWQEASDRAVALETGASRAMVGAVRRQMIAAGTHPPRNEDRPLLDAGKIARGYIRAYKLGAVARGGYVYGRDGRMVREVDWLTAEAERLGRPLRELLKKLRI